MNTQEQEERYRQIELLRRSRIPSVFCHSTGGGVNKSRRGAHAEARIVEREINVTSDVDSLTLQDDNFFALICAILEGDVTLTDDEVSVLNWTEANLSDWLGDLISYQYENIPVVRLVRDLEENGFLSRIMDEFERLQSE